MLSISRPIYCSLGWGEGEWVYIRTQTFPQRHLVQLWDEHSQKNVNKVYKRRDKGQIKHLVFTILVQTIPLVFSVFSKKNFETLPNYDSNINLLIFPSWIILFMTYLKYFQVNNQYEEMRVLSSWKWVQAHRLRTKGSEVRPNIMYLRKLKFWSKLN